MSYARSPRPVFSMTIGIKDWFLAVITYSQLSAFVFRAGFCEPGRLRTGKILDGPESPGSQSPALSQVFFCFFFSLSASTRISSTRPYSSASRAFM